METTFNWRTAPRSITRLIDWLPYFDKFQNEDYQLVVPNQDPDTSKSFKNLRPTRRAIRYAFESDLDFPDKLVTIPYQDFLKGKQPDGDTADKESIVRQVVTTAEQYGFMDASNANLTPIGRRIVDGTFNAEDFLAQLLKMYIVVDGEGVFPIKTVIKLIDKFEYISRNEMTFIFGQIHDSDYKTTEKAVSDFRRRYADLPARNDTKAVEDLVEDVWNTYLPPVPTKKIKSILKDYTDALRRSLEFTEMFYSHGRGTATKLRVSELNQTKFKQLVEKYTFVTPPLQVIKGESVQLGSRDSLEWYGAVGNVALPWDNVDERRELVQDKLDLASKLYSEVPEPAFTSQRASDLLKSVVRAPIATLKDIESELDSVVLDRKEQLFVQVESKSRAVRREILERFDTILTDNDMSALWLEVNTWKAFVALNGDNKKVVHNFKMNPDLTPKSFAPGTGNTPDMEVYYNNSIILPEVSLMTGVQQWEHEGSSVIDHVLRKIEQNKDTGKRVIGLFISSRMNVRTMWQFFLLNRESWIGQPVPVVPLTIKQFSETMKVAYKTDASIYDVAALVDGISQVTLSMNNYEEWSKGIELLVDTWMKGRVENYG